MPISTTKVTMRSVQPNCRTAEIDAGQQAEDGRSSTKEAPASISVGLKRSSTSSITGRLSDVGAAEIAMQHIAESR